MESQTRNNVKNIRIAFSTGVNTTKNKKEIAPNSSFKRSVMRVGESEPIEEVPEPQDNINLNVSRPGLYERNISIECPQTTRAAHSGTITKKPSKLFIGSAEASPPSPSQRKVVTTKKSGSQQAQVRVVARLRPINKIEEVYNLQTMI